SSRLAVFDRVLGRVVSLSRNAPRSSSMLDLVNVPLFPCRSLRSTSFTNYSLERGQELRPPTWSPTLMERKYTWLMTGLLGLASLAASMGCRDNVRDQVAAMNTSNIRRVANLYAAFQTYRGGHGPKDEAELKEFARTYDTNRLSMMQIDPQNIDG